MGATVTSDTDFKLFVTLSMILQKNKCRVVEMDLESGILDIKGLSEEAERTCTQDMQKAFARYLFY